MVQFKPDTIASCGVGFSAHEAMGATTSTSAAVTQADAQA